MEGTEERTGLSEQDVRKFILGVVGKLGIDPYQYTFGELVDINQVYEREKQIDRACAAQSPEMLPRDEISTEKLNVAVDRIKEEKSQYKVPAQSWRFDQTFSPHEPLSL